MCIIFKLDFFLQPPFPLLRSSHIVHVHVHVHVHLYATNLIQFHVLMIHVLHAILFHSFRIRIFVFYYNIMQHSFFLHTSFFKKFYFYFFSLEIIISSFFFPFFFRSPYRCLITLPIHNDDRLFRHIPGVSFSTIACTHFASVLQFCSDLHSTLRPHHIL